MRRKRNDNEIIKLLDAEKNANKYTEKVCMNAKVCYKILVIEAEPYLEIYMK